MDITHSPTRIFAFSDWRIQRIDRLIEYIEGLDKRPDIIVYAGDDIARFNRIDESKIPKILRKAFLEQDGPPENYFEKIGAIAEYGIVAVAGNDDFPFMRDAISGQNVYNIHDNPRIIDDFAFIGLEGAPSGPGFLLHNEKYIEEHMNKMLKLACGKDLIIVSHAPPYGILDIGIRFGIGHIGSQSLRKFLDQNNERIRLLFCGHAHSQGGKEKIHKKTTVLNCSSHDNEGEPGKIVVVETGDKPRLKWDLVYDWGAFPKNIQNLMDIPLVGDTRAKAFSEIGVKSISQVAKINPRDPTFQKFKCFSTSSLGLIKNYAEAIRKNKVIVTGTHPFFTASRKICFFDAEYNPTGTKIGPYGIFLIGIMDQKGEVIQHFLDNPENEKTILWQFIEWLRKEKPSLVSYASTSADRPQLINAFKRFGIPSEEIERSFFDLYYECINTQKAETQYIFLPMRGSMNLKDVTTHFGYRQPFSVNISDGLQALLTYEKYLQTKRKKLKYDLLNYNQTDLERTKFIFNKIRGFMERGERDTKSVCSHL